MTISGPHILKVNHPPVRGVIDSVYQSSFTDTRRSGHKTKGGRANAWVLDLKRVLSSGELLSPIAKGMVDIAREIGVHQVVGFGYGSYFLVGAISVLDPDIRVGVVRDERKSYGFRGIVEGDLNSAAPTIIVDDIVNSGSTSIRAANLLRRDNYNPTTVLAVFEFQWGGAAKRLIEDALELRALATLSRRNTHGRG
jgi:orotate phosphoribosyltransferase